MSEITGGELLVRCLHAEGVDNIHEILDHSYGVINCWFKRVVENKE